MYDLTQWVCRLECQSQRRKERFRFTCDKYKRQGNNYQSSWKGGLAITDTKYLVNSLHVGFFLAVE